MNFLDSIVATVGPYIPRLVGAIVLIIVAIIVARVVKFALRKALTAAKFDARLKSPSLTARLANVAYYLVLLLFLPAILGVLGLQGMLAPIQNLVNQILLFLPNIAAAAVIFIMGYIVASIVRTIVTDLLRAAGTEKLAARVGMSTALGAQGLSGLIGLVLFVMILLPVITAALNALQLPAVAQPVSDLLNKILSAIPNILAAAVLVLISYFIARLISGLVSSLLQGVGFDRILVILGVGEAPVATDGTSTQLTPSRAVGLLVMLAIMFFAATEAAGLLGFATLSQLIAQFTVLAGQIVLGLVILAIGVFLANFAARIIAGSNVENGAFLAGVARIAILVLAAGMALRQMGIANDIINLAFGLLLGAVAVAAAVAFGIGGRGIAADLLGDFVATNLKHKESMSAEASRMQQALLSNEASAKEWEEKAKAADALAATRGAQLDRLMVVANKYPAALSFWLTLKDLPAGNPEDYEKQVAEFASKLQTYKQAGA